VRNESVTYKLLDGSSVSVEYDADAPCWACGLPVMAASMGGTVLCSWCDCGNGRDGHKLSMEENMVQSANWRRSERAGKWVGVATEEEVGEQQRGMFAYGVGSAR
jgi:hypothetical protein